MTREQDNLYEAVNGEWLSKTVIPADKAAAGGFAELRDGVEEKMKHDLSQMAAGEASVPFPELATALTFYRLAADFASRDAAGVTPATTWLAQLAAVPTVADFNTHAASLARAQFAMPFSLSVTPDMKDTTHNVVRIAGPSPILPDPTYYGEARGDKLMATWTDMAKALLAATDLPERAQTQYVVDSLAFDNRVAHHVKTRVQWADRVKSYNPQSMADVAGQFGDFDFTAFAKAMLPSVPERVIVADPAWLASFTEIFNAHNYPEYLHWAYVQGLIAAAPYLSDSLRQTGDAYDEARAGNPEPVDQPTQAYELTNLDFAEPIGVYYGRKYFGEAAKANVIDLVKQMIATYKRRIRNSDWLSAPTKEKAVTKLDTMGLRMGYPDAPHPMYSELTVDPSLDLWTNARNLASFKQAYQLRQLDSPVDRTVWAMPGHLVNACYRSSWNDITFPAAILQAPFYSLEHTPSQNFGGIGAVIAHEISHGFDNNGAQFDEHGNMVNWWTDADYAHFKALTNAMIDQFDGLETEAGKVNGRLVVSENIADAGGLAAAADTAMHLEHPDMQAFFRSWARIWGQKTRIERQQLLLATDVHAPHPLRANIQPRNLDEWYTAFNVQPTDGMYLAPDKRIHIW